MTEQPKQVPNDCPEAVGELASRAVSYVQDSLGVEIEYDSDTLPLLDHYLRSVPADRQDLIDLVCVTAGAYFGEVVRRRLGGRWDIIGDDPADWKLVLTTGLRFSPGAAVEEAIRCTDEGQCLFEPPPRLQEHVESALSRMGEVTEEEYYSLCGRLDTLEHLHAVLLAVAAELAKTPLN